MQLTSSKLFTICDKVPHGQDVSDLIEGMFAVARGHNPIGAGLAANQVGHALRVIILNTQYIQAAFINPVITKRACGKVTNREGCLSFYGGRKTVRVERDKQITLEGFDANWQPVKMKLRGLESIIVQHEIDHLDAITIFPEGEENAL